MSLLGLITLSGMKPARNRSRSPIKILLTAIVFCAAEFSSYGQGQIWFFNSYWDTETWITTNSIPGGPPTGIISGPVGSYFFALFAAPPGTLDPNAFTFTGHYATNYPTAGRLYGGITQLPGVDVDEYCSVIIRGWSGNIGHDYSAVTDYLANPTFVAWYGESQIATLRLGGGETPTPLLFGTSPGQMPGFNLGMYPIPEPSGLALAGLVAATVVAFRRRQRFGTTKQP